MGKAGTRSTCGVHALLGHSYFVFTCTSRACLIDKWQCVMSMYLRGTLETAEADEELSSVCLT